MPQAVARGTNGYLRVFYEKLGLRFDTYHHWIRSRAALSAHACFTERLPRVLATRPGSPSPAIWFHSRRFPFSTPSSFPDWTFERDLGALRIHDTMMWWFWHDRCGTQTEWVQKDTMPKRPPKIGDARQGANFNPLPVSEDLNCRKQSSSWHRSTILISISSKKRNWIWTRESQRSADTSMSSSS
jgi:hypothetical protein